jgi:Ca-activated chloride channel family protein
MRPVCLAAAFLFALGTQTGVTRVAQDPPRPPGPADQDRRLSLRARLVSVTVSVTDTYGRNVTGLEQQHFEVFDNGVKQEIAHFTDEDAPISLGIIYDVSGSMTDLTARSFAALNRFFEVSHKDDEFFLIAFNDKARLIQDFTVSPNDILGRVTLVKARGSTALYDAVYLAVEKAKQGRHAKKALLIISDGQENNSRYSGKELRSLLREADVQIYGIGITQDFSGAGTLRELAALTGGAVFFPMLEQEVQDAYTRIAIALRHQYSLGFYPSPGRPPAGVRSDGEPVWHRLDVRVKPIRGLGRLALRHRKGYQSFTY